MNNFVVPETPLKETTIVLGGFDPRETILFGLDCFDCNVQEFRCDPSAKWYSFKSIIPG